MSALPSTPTRTDLLDLLGCTLEQLTTSDEPYPSDDNDTHLLSFFHLVAVPPISIRDYLTRIAAQTQASDEALTLACLHVATLADQESNAQHNIRMNPQSPHPFSVSRFNIHCLLLAAVLVSAKMVDDQFINNKDMALVGAIKLSHLNHIEHCLLLMLGHCVHRSVEDFHLGVHWLQTAFHAQCKHVKCESLFHEECMLDIAIQKLSI